MKKDIEEIIKKLLPTNEEIEKEGFHYVNDEYQADTFFEKGAMWLRDLIIKKLEEKENK